MEDELIIHVKNDGAVRVEAHENGIVSTKHISPDALVECIKDSIRGGIKLTSGVLPENTVSVTVKTEDRSFYVVVDFRETRSDITYMQTVFPDFPLPRLLFGFRVEQSGRISAVKLGVPADERLTEETQMFYYPFSNVNRFSMCTGTNTLPDISTLRSLSNLPYFILSFPDNDDYFKPEYNRLKAEHRDLMEHLRDKDRAYYYSDILIPMRGVTLKKFCEEC